MKRLINLFRVWLVGINEQQVDKYLRKQHPHSGAVTTYRRGE